jgi:2,3-bisphosphoglycerate-dependent phosphoglycerate mutase
MKLVIIRHGETKFNSEMKKGLKYCAGCINNEFADLNENGKEMAKKLSENEIVRKINKIYVSDLNRAIDTVKISKPNFEYISSSQLRERSLGVFEGKTKDEIMKTPDYNKYYTNPKYMEFKDSFTMKAPGGENYSEVLIRVMNFLENIKYEDNDVIGIYSHFCAIRCMFCGLLKIEPKEKIFNLKIKNCEPYVFEGDTIKNLKLVSHDIESLFL